MFKKAYQVQITDEYHRFRFDESNRSVGNVARLMACMKRFGFHPAYPLHCVKDGAGYVIKDGQHRFQAAKDLCIPVYFADCDDDPALSIAMINLAQRPWTMKDFATSYMNQGSADYTELVEFAKEHDIPMGVSASLLSGQQAASGNVQRKLRDGFFVIKNRDFAQRVAALLTACRPYVKFAGNTLFIDALCKCAFVSEFTEKQFLQKVVTFPHMLALQPTSDAFLRMLDALYNYKASKRIPLHHLASEAARQRNATTPTARP